MDKVRRSLVISTPVVTVLGLTACGGGGEAATQTTQAHESGTRAQVQAVTSSNNTGLLVNGSQYFLGAFWKLADSIFLSGSQPITMVPDASLVHGCNDNGTLQLTMWMGTETHQRAVTMKLRAPVKDKIYDVSQLPTGEAALVVTVMQFDTTTGKGSSAHYDYLLNSGQVKVISEPGVDVTLTFTAVKGTVTSTALVPNNVATRPLQLDGTITVRLGTPQTVDWLA